MLTCDRPRVVAQDPLFCAKECMCGASQHVHSQEVSKKMTKLLRDDRSVLREDGAVEFRNSGTDGFLTIRIFSALVKSNMAYTFAKRRRSQEEISVLPGSLFTLRLFFTFEQFKAILEDVKLIQHCKTT